jgi:hypothetical protein
VTNVCIVHDLHVAVKNIIPLSAVMKMQDWVPISLLATNKVIRSAVNRLKVYISSCHLHDMFVKF